MIFSIVLYTKCLTGKLGQRKHVTHRQISGSHSRQSSEVNNKAHLRHLLSCRIKHPIPLIIITEPGLANASNRLLCSLQTERLLLATGRTVIDRWWDSSPVKSQIHSFSQARHFIFLNINQEIPN